MVRKPIASQALVAHAYNPNYSASKDQDDHGLKPTQTNSSQDPILKYSTQKRAGWWLKPSKQA
jgi:hypothetical protein